VSWKQTALLISNRDIVISPLLHHYYLRFRFNASTSHTTGRKGLVTHLSCPQTDLLIASVVMELVSPGFKHNTEEALLVNSHPPTTASIPNHSLYVIAFNLLSHMAKLHKFYCGSCTHI